MHHVDVAGVLTDDECDVVVRTAEAQGMEAATVYGGEDHVDPDVRRAERTYLARTDPATTWLYDRLDDLLARAADHLGVGALAPVTEDVQVVRYGVGDHFQTWHSDAGTDRHGQRVLSVSVELSASDDHAGGDLEIAPGTVGLTRMLPKGGARVFRSQALHRVTPVTAGVRWALVAWTGSAQEPGRASTTRRTISG